ncbi:MAG: hypothetical protein ACI9S8_002696 [Chlamydiales bacterium]|jgi:hypothetical protein
MNLESFSTQSIKDISSLGLAFSIGEASAHYLRLGQIGFGGAFGATAYLINRVISSQFEKYVKLPERDFNNPIEAFSKLSVYGTSYAASKVAVIALTIATSYAVTSALGLVAVGSALGGLAASEARLTSFTLAAYVVGMIKSGIFGSEESWDFAHIDNRCEQPQELSCTIETAIPTREILVSPRSNIVNRRINQAWVIEARGRAFHISEDLEPPMVTPVDSRVRELRAEDRDREFGINLSRAFREGRVLSSPPETPKGSKIGSLRMPTAVQVNQIKVNDSHYNHVFPPVTVPFESWDESFTPHELVMGKAREFHVSLDEFSRIGTEILNPIQIPPYFTEKHQNMYKKVIKHLMGKEIVAVESRDTQQMNLVNEQWKSVLEHLEAGSGNCPDPIREQIEQLYHNFFIEERNHLAKFEEKVQGETRVLRDQLFREACSEVIRTLGGAGESEYATTYEYLKGNFSSQLNLTPGSGSYFNRRVPEYQSKTVIKFKEKYTAERITQHLMSKKDNGKDRFGFQEIQSWLSWKSGAEEVKVGVEIFGGLDHDGMPNNDSPTKAAWVMILRSLDKPVIN